MREACAPCLFGCEGGPGAHHARGLLTHYDVRKHPLVPACADKTHALQLQAPLHCASLFSLARRLEGAILLRRPELEQSLPGSPIDSTRGVDDMGGSDGMVAVLSVKKGRRARRCHVISDQMAETSSRWDVRKQNGSTEALAMLAV